VTSGARLFDEAVSRTSVVLPSGAGGGDIVLLIGNEPPGDEAERAGQKAGFVPLPLTLGARGVHASAREPRRAGRDAGAA